MIARYARWLHTRWPAGRIEKLPDLSDGRTNVPGVLVVGDLSGVPLIKFALQSGTRAARTIAEDPTLRAGDDDPSKLDLVIVGAGVAGIAAAVEARRLGLSCEILETNQAFSTLVHMPKAKPIYTYPTEMVPEGGVQVTALVKEDLIAELERQRVGAGIAPRAERAERIERQGRDLVVRLAGGGGLRTRRVVIAIGRSGDFRRLGVPGEHLDKVYDRLHDPNDFAGRRALVIGGGDSAVETALALAEAGAQVTLIHRGAELSRPKPENLTKLASARSGPAHLELRLGTRVAEILPDRVELVTIEGHRSSLDNDVVFAMVGREAPLEFFRRSGIRIRGDFTPLQWAGFSSLLLLCVWLYNWKSGGRFATLWAANRWFPFNLPDLLAAAGGSIAVAAADPRTVLGTLAISATSPSFWYTLTYSIVVVTFGIRRVRRRATPYVAAQTTVLALVQVVPLFLLPELLLPWLHHVGSLPTGLADALFPAVSYGHGREFWRAYGLILAWPLNVYNVFTQEPLWWWIGIGALQTFVLIPWAIYHFGKGVYCGWICSCGALAETLGDDHRQKMPHGPGWNRLNLAGQAVLAIAFILLAVRIAGWALPDGNWAAARFEGLKDSYKWTVDVFLAGVLGYGAYFWWSGRVWCRFFCPLAALMHVYARFSRFAIVAEKRRCISCSVCTSVCHQGIDVMSFANKGLPMIDPQCVRCSACVESCPTGTLQFGQVRKDGALIRLDSIAASPVLMRERAGVGNP